MKKFLSFLLCLTLLFGLFPAVPAYAAVDWPAGVSISADGGVVIDANSGAVLYGKNMQETFFPASITKILTALLIIENCDLDDTVTFSNAAVNTLEPGASILGARAGDKMNVRDCLYALLLQSANEVANALAEHCAGSIDAFAEMMNRKAESLGCINTHFSNPSGLNDDNHYTSAFDMALIAKAAFENPTFVQIDSTTYYDVPVGQLQQYPDGWRYYAHHRMLKKDDSKYYDGIIGGKTGYTSLAGNTLVTCAERDGLKLIAVVLNGHLTHYEDTKIMLDFGFGHFKSIPIATQDSTYQKIENDLTVSGITSGTGVRLSIDKNSMITLPTDGEFSDVTSELNYNLSSAAPEAAVARIDYMYGDRKVGQAYLEASQAIGYVPGSTAGLETSQDSGAVTTIEVTGKSTENSTAETGKDAVVQPENGEKKPRSGALSVLKKVLTVVVILGILCAAVFALLAYRRHKEERERMIRRQRREKRLKEWGYSSSEFDSIMEEHLRSKSGFKKQSFWDRFRR